MLATQGRCLLTSLYTTPLCRPLPHFVISQRNYSGYNRHHGAKPTSRKQSYTREQDKKNQKAKQERKEISEIHSTYSKAPAKAVKTETKKKRDKSHDIIDLSGTAKNALYEDELSQQFDITKKGWNSLPGLDQVFYKIEDVEAGEDGQEIPASISENMEDIEEQALSNEQSDEKKAKKGQTEPKRIGKDVDKGKGGKVKEEKKGKEVTTSKEKKDKEKKGKEAKGKEAKGKEAKGKEAKGKELKGKETSKTAKGKSTSTSGVSDKKSIKGKETPKDNKKEAKKDKGKQIVEEKKSSKVKGEEKQNKKETKKGAITEERAKEGGGVYSKSFPNLFPPLNESQPSKAVKKGSKRDEALLEEEVDEAEEEEANAEEEKGEEAEEDEEGFEEEEDVPGVTAADAFNTRPEKLREAAGGKPMFTENFPTVEEIVSILRAERAKDLVVLDMSKKCSYADYFIIATGRSDNHCTAIAENVVRRYRPLLKKAGLNANVEGAGTPWAAVDIGSIVLHLFNTESRAYMAIDKNHALKTGDIALRDDEEKEFFDEVDKWEEKRVKKNKVR